MVAGGILRDVEAIRDGLVAVGHGRSRGDDRDRGPRRAGRAGRGRERDDRPTARGGGGRDQSEAARRDLIAAVSHDLRTPITSLRLLADAVGDDIVEDAETRRVVPARGCGTHIDALGALIDDLFELSRLEAGDISWTLRAGAAAGAGRGDGRGDAGPGRGQGGGGSGRGPVDAEAGPGQPREAPARPVQPDPERDPPHARRRQRRRARRAGRRPESRSRWPTPATGSPRGARARVHRVLPGRHRRGPHRARAPGSGWPSRARSSRLTADGSGWPTRRWAHACGSACRRRSPIGPDGPSRRLRPRPARRRCLAQRPGHATSDGCRTAARSRLRR